MSFFQHQTYLEAAETLRPNAPQWQAYESQSHCVVLAGPGSGKTRLLSIKLARMLAEDVVLPRGIACITYSNECARELTRRLAGLGVRPSPTVFIGTVHSFCLKNILVPFGHLVPHFNLPRPIQVASQDEQQRLFALAYNTIVNDNADPSWRRAAVDRYRRTYLDRDDPNWETRNTEITSLITNYETLLRNNGLIDFDDMVLFGLRIVEASETVRTVLHARFPIIVVDEYQDLGHPLHELVQQLCFTGRSRLFAVGDVHQTIYSFAGADPSLLEELARREDVETVQLALNYRCGRTILAASHITMPPAAGYRARDGAATGTVDIYECPGGIEEQSNKICTEIIPSLLVQDPELTLGDMAILYIDRQDGSTMARAVSNAGYLYLRIDGDALYRRTLLTRWIEDCAAWFLQPWGERQRGLLQLYAQWQSWCFLGVGEGALWELRRALTRFLFRGYTPDTALAIWLDDLERSCLRQVFDATGVFRDDQRAFRTLKQLVQQGDLRTLTDLAGQRGAPTHLNLTLQRELV